MMICINIQINCEYKTTDYDKIGIIINMIYHKMSKTQHDSFVQLVLSMIIALIAYMVIF